MAHVTITLTDDPSVDNEIRVEATFEPELPAKDGEPDMEQATDAQKVALNMLMSGMRSGEAHSPRVEGEREDGSELVIEGESGRSD